MSMQVGNGKGIRPVINVTPLIDVVLVLLIIFMVVTPMLTKGISLPLPQTKDPDKKPDDPKDIIISLPDDNKINLFGNNQTVWVTKNDLEETLRTWFERDPDSPLFIKADKKLKYGRVKEIMLVCEKAGFKGVSLVTEQARKGGQ